MLSEIIRTEINFNALLPLHGRQISPAAELMTAAKLWSLAVWNEAEQIGAILLSDEEIAQSKSLMQNAVFICGVHRSGTTLVRDLLDGHPDIIVLPSEGTYYTNLEVKLQVLAPNDRLMFLGTEWLQRLANPINQPPYWLLGRSGNSGSPYVNFLRYFMAWWNLLCREEKTQWPHMAIVFAYASCMGKMQAKLWVDKTPTNERFLNRIWHELPQARIIHVIREPVATLTSRKRMEPGFSIRKALYDLKVSFNIAVKYSSLKDPRIFVLRYEELCEAPQKIIAQVTSFLSISPSTTLSEPTVAGMQAYANSSFNKKAIAGQILKPNQHLQQKVLNKTEHLLITAFIGKLITKLNYRILHKGFLQKLYLRVEKLFFI
jgi:hypothetical protein